MSGQESKVRFVTLGCRVNQYETQGMRELAGNSGFETFSGCGAHDPAFGHVGYVVVNTCTVTREADRESRYWIRRARREHPQAKIVVTGCGVEKDAGRFLEMPEVDGILPNARKADIAGALKGDPYSPESASEPAARRVLYSSELAISRSEGRTRAFVKIQDGCNHACSFCKVVLLRGKSRSRALSQIVEETVRLRDHGYREIVLTGIQLGAYGLDLEGKRLLPDVLFRISQIEGIERVRLSSIEPLDITGDLISAFKEIPRCMPHLHIPLQSGDDEILKKMNRRYTRAFYSDLILRLRSELRDFLFSLDVMAGFPGEEESHFARTVELLRDLKPLKCHVFPYSRREGTVSSRMTGAVPAQITKRRVRELMRLGDHLTREAMEPYLGKCLSVLIEGKLGEDDEAGAYLTGHTHNFMKVAVSENAAAAGQIVPVRLTGIRGDVFWGEAETEINKG